MYLAIVEPDECGSLMRSLPTEPSYVEVDCTNKCQTVKLSDLNKMTIQSLSFSN